MLRSHRGWDPGALRCARRLAADLGAPLLWTDLTRLLVDANRSATNPAVFSPWTRGLAAEERARLLAMHHAPHRTRVEHAVREVVGRRRAALHLAIHSFTPRPHGRERYFDVGFLYDPARPGERRLAEAWKDALAQLQPELRVRRNAPYRGRDDGLTRSLRARFGPDRYLGLELELNQAWCRRPGPGADRAVDALRESLQVVLGLGKGPWHPE